MIYVLCLFISSSAQQMENPSRKRAAHGRRKLFSAKKKKTSHKISVGATDHSYSTVTHTVSCACNETQTALLSAASDSDTVSESSHYSCEIDLGGLLPDTEPEFSWDTCFITPIKYPECIANNFSPVPKIVQCEGTTPAQKRKHLGIMRKHSKHTKLSVKAQHCEGCPGYVRQLATHGTQYDTADFSWDDTLNRTEIITCGEDKTHHLPEILYMAPSNVLEDAAEKLSSYTTWLEIVSQLKEQCLLEDFLRFVEAMRKGLIPPRHISLLSLLDTAKFVSLSSSCGMRYYPETKKFWLSLYKEVDGKSIRLAGGPKHAGKVRSGELVTGHFPPQTAQVNYAVPSVQALTKGAHKKLNKVVQPGIIADALEMLNPNAEYILSVDGKKIAPGINGNRNGDINLWGFEGPPSLEENLRENAAKINQCYTALTNNGANLPDVVTAISQRIHEMRTMVCAYQRIHASLTKKKERNPDKEACYTYGMQSVSTHILLSAQSIEALLNTNAALCEVMVQQKLPLTSDINSQPDEIQGNCNELLQPDEMREYMDVDNVPHLIKQGSDEWLELRKKSRITGSSIHNAIGLRTMAEYKKHYRAQVLQEEQKPKSHSVQDKLDYGRTNEKNGIATLCASYMPAFHGRCCSFYEVGCEYIASDIHDKLLEVSADGTILCAAGKEHHCFAVEVKCPFPGDTTRLLQHYTLPDYYACQVLSEMAALNRKKALYVCYTPSSCTFLEVTFDNILWSKIMQNIEEMYGTHDVKVLEHIPHFRTETKLQLKEFCDRNCRFVAELPSKKCERRGTTYSEATCPYYEAVAPAQKVNGERVTRSATIERAVDCLKESYKLLRKRATEVLVFILSDINRLAEPQKPLSIPVAYAMAGKSVNNKALRLMIQKVRKECLQKNITIVAEAFDGQWSKAVTHASDDSPLTRLQLAKKTWNEVKKVGKAKMITTLCSLTEVTEEDKAALQNTTNDTQNMRTGNFVLTRGDSQQLIINSNKCALRQIVTPQHMKPKIHTSVLVTENVGNLLLFNVDEASHSEICTKLTMLCGSLIDSVAATVGKSKKLDNANPSHDTTLQIVRDAKVLNSYLTVVLLDSILSQLNTYFKTTLCPKNVKKGHKCNIIAKFFGGTESQVFVRERKVRTLKKLASCVLAAKNYPKECLHIAYSIFLHKEKKVLWEGAATIDTVLPTSNTGETTATYCYPEKCPATEQLLFRLIDPTHILTNLRAKCTKGIHKIADRRAWLYVCDNTEKILSKAVVIDCIDKQDGALAQRFFSAEVEEVMRSNAEFKETADFIELIRNWFEAVDKRGLSALSRVRAMMALYKFLTADVDFDTFPPPGAYVKGVPIVTYEAILMNVTVRLAMYAFCEHKTYNHRALSTLAAENFFSTMGSFAGTATTTPKAVNICTIMSDVTFINMVKNETDRYVGIVHSTHPADLSLFLCTLD